MMSGDDNYGQMIFRDLGGLKLLDICLTGEEKLRKNLTQETCPDLGSNPGPLRDRRACYCLSHSGGLHKHYFNIDEIGLTRDPYINRISSLQLFLEHTGSLIFCDGKHEHKKIPCLNVT